MSFAISRDIVICLNCKNSRCHKTHLEEIFDQMIASRDNIGHMFDFDIALRMGIPMDALVDTGLKALFLLILNKKLCNKIDGCNGLHFADFAALTRLQLINSYVLENNLESDAILISFATTACKNVRNCEDVDNCIHYHNHPHRIGDRAVTKFIDMGWFSFDEDPTDLQNLLKEFIS